MDYCQVMTRYYFGALHDMERKCSNIACGTLVDGTPACKEHIKLEKRVLREKKQKEEEARAIFRFEKLTEEFNQMYGLKLDVSKYGNVVISIETLWKLMKGEK